MQRSNKLYWNNKSNIFALCEYQTIEKPSSINHLDLYVQVCTQAKRVLHCKVFQKVGKRIPAYSGTTLYLKRHLRAGRSYYSRNKPDFLYFKYHSTLITIDELNRILDEMMHAGIHDWNTRPMILSEHTLWNTISVKKTTGDSPVTSPKRRPIIN